MIVSLPKDIDLFYCTLCASIMLNTGHYLHKCIDATESVPQVACISSITINDRHIYCVQWQHTTGGHNAMWRTQSLTWN